MSKNITIQEGGVAKQLSVDKLKTNLVDSGTCLWVPEDETQLQVKYIDANGEYEASAENIYGYSKVVVRVPGGAGGEGPGGSGEAVPGGPGSSVVGTDEDGDEAEVSVDSGGEINTQKIPSSIRVLEPPTNPYGIYQDGQTISTDGMRVDAYLKSGDRWQTVPSNQISLDPTVAIYDASKDRPGGKKVADTPLDIGNASIFIGSGVPLVYYTPTSGPSSSTSPFSFGYPDGVVYTLDAWHESVNSIGYYMIVASDTFSSYVGGATYTYDGKTVYYKVSDSAMSEQNSSVDGTNAPLSSYDKSKAAAIAWSMVYGTIEETPAGSPQTITASWPQPRTGKPLTDTFEILVAPGYGGDEGENGNAGTPPPGMLIP